MSVGLEVSYIQISEVPQIPLTAEHDLRLYLVFWVMVPETCGGSGVFHLTCNQVTVHAWRLSQLCEERYGSWTDPFHDAEQLEEGKASELNWVSPGSFAHISGLCVKLCARCGKYGKNRLRKTVMIVFICRPSFDWVVTMATNVYECFSFQYCYETLNVWKCLIGRQKHPTEEETGD